MKRENNFKNYLDIAFKKPEVNEGEKTGDPRGK